MIKRAFRPYKFGLIPLFLGSLLLFFNGILPESLRAATPRVLFIELSEDTINPVTAEYIETAIDEAHENDYECLVIKLDTPGGLLSSTRHIVKNILVADLPVIVYISPDGARAGSAGVFITYASHLAAMAPSTNIGAAHPVQIGGDSPAGDRDWDEFEKLIDELKELRNDGKEDAADTEETGEKDTEDEKEEPLVDDPDPMSSKILQDTVAFIRALAKQRDRNEDWAIESVTKSSSITAEEALEKKVIEVIATSDRDLLQKIDARTIVIKGVDHNLQTADAEMVYQPMTTRLKILNILANPNFAYFLIILGFYGLFFEVTNPGIGVPGVLGAIFLIIGAYSMQILPVNYAGLALLFIGLALLVAEAFIPGMGLLTLGGATCFVLGSLFLFDASDPIMRVSLYVIITLAAGVVLVSLFVVRSIVRALKGKVTTGSEGMIGTIAVAQKDFNDQGEGRVFVRGESWNAVSTTTAISKGQKVNILDVNGLTLQVEPLKGKV